MTDDVLALLRSLPPDLSDPADRLHEVKVRVLRRRRRRAVAATVLAVAAVTVPLAWLPAGAPAPANTPLTCPAVDVGVPDLPRGVDGRSRLVPPVPPTRALLCAYEGTTGQEQTGWALTGSRELSGGLDRLAADLTLVGRDTGGVACTLMGGRQVNYLLGLNYEGGTLWVSTVDEPNHCADARNGQFTGRLMAGGVAKAFAASYTAGTWIGPPPPATAYPCAVGAAGRLGQDAALVPADPVSVEICQEDVRSVTLTRGFTDLVDAINGLPTQIARAGCSPVVNQPIHYLLVFRYAEGPSVVIHVLDGCEPAIDNGSLAASDATPVLPIIGQLLEAG